eukprot:1236782-Ditylum_brightwellii.AAC.1
MSKHEPQEEPKGTNNMSYIVKKNEPSKSNTELNKPKIEPIDTLDGDKSDNLKSSKNAWYTKAE